jgi:hypothetical protein
LAAKLAVDTQFLANAIGLHPKRVQVPIGFP